MSLHTVIYAGLLALTMGTAAAAETRLVMAEEDGCIWCARWNEELGDIYPKTGAGKAAPLVRIDVHAPRTEGLTFARSLHFTPTFVLMIDGAEVSRIEGYPGEDFFWGLLEKMLTTENIAILE